MGHAGSSEGVWVGVGACCRQNMQSKSIIAYGESQVVLVGLFEASS